MKDSLFWDFEKWFIERIKNWESVGQKVVETIRGIIFAGKYQL